MFTTTTLRRVLAATTLSLASLAAQAGLINVDASNSGWYTSSGSQNGTTANLNADSSGPAGQTRNNWLGFDLTGVTGTIVSARLEVASDPQNDSGQLFSWSGVSTPYASLGTVSSVAIFNDLGDGPIYAQGTHTAGIINLFDINGAGIAALNAALGSMWAIGGSHDGAGGIDAFGFTSGVNQGDHLRLVLNTAAVPEPTGLALCGLGIAAFGARRRRV
ncbi:MAG: PEP-CTERM sorting domain-containing protein [Gammaproteobacteria bacterium]|nr:PEP-CTERM sorting domain-containing protein [Gammaproteobacteria bacterium]MCP5200151.1 PEP-CTERM sorting domain-containing protein [Gammaproteobacteria bacterium]